MIAMAGIRLGESNPFTFNTVSVNQTNKLKKNAIS